MSAPVVSDDVLRVINRGLPSSLECVREDPALAVQWPDSRAEYIVSVYAPELGEEPLELLGFNGCVELASDPGVIQEAWPAIGSEPAAGYYLLAMRQSGSDSGFDGRLIAYETEDQRAERLARGGR